MIRKFFLVSINSKKQEIKVLEFADKETAERYTKENKGDYLIMDGSLTDTPITIGNKVAKILNWTPIKYANL